MDTMTKNTFDNDLELLFKCYEYVVSVNGGEFCLRQGYEKIFSGLVSYFNNDSSIYDPNKNILLLGCKGITDYSVIVALEMYLKISSCDKAFDFVTGSEILNYYRVNNHLNLFTFNEDNRGRCNPKNIFISYRDNTPVLDELINDRRAVKSLYYMYCHVAMDDDCTDSFNFNEYNLINL